MLDDVGRFFPLISNPKILGGEDELILNIQLSSNGLVRLVLHSFDTDHQITHYIKFPTVFGGQESNLIQT